MRALCAVAILAMLLTACGQADNQTSPAGRTDSGSSTPSTPPDSQPPSTIAEPTPPQVPPATPTIPPGAVKPVPQEQVEARNLPDQKVIAVDDGRTLQFTAMARDACSGVEATVAEQNDTMVRILLAPAAMPQGGPPDGQMCAQVLTPRVVTVKLDAPLGNRKVIISETY